MCVCACMFVYIDMYVCVFVCIRIHPCTRVGRGRGKGWRRLRQLYLPNDEARKLLVTLGSL